MKGIRDFFGGADLGFTEEDLIEPDTFIQLGVAPTRIDLIKSLGGVPTFEDAWQRRIDANYGGTPAHYLSLEDLILAKEHAGREQDIADLRHLRRIRSERS